MSDEHVNHHFEDVDDFLSRFSDDDDDFGVGGKLGVKYKF